MFWELLRDSQIRQANWTAEEAKSTATDAQSDIRLLKGRIRALEETVDRLSLAAIAVAEILQDRLGVTPSEFETRMQEIDLRDQTRSERLRPSTNYCQHCDHMNAPDRRVCLYCGEPLPAHATAGTSSP
jgi:hypothetical protein